MSYFQASYRGTDKGTYGSRSRINILITKKLFGGYKVTPCHGYELKPMVGMTLHYESLDDLINEWDLIRPIETDEYML